MKAEKGITAGQSRFAAQIFNLASIAATVVPVLLVVWAATSIFVYAWVAHHPNPCVAYYNRMAGYRFYGPAGFLVVMGQSIYSHFGSWHGLLALWALLAICVIPLGIRDLIRVRRENWQDMAIEEHKHG